MQWFKTVWWHLTHEISKRELHRGSKSFRCLADVVSFERKAFGEWIEISRRGVTGISMSSSDMDIYDRDGKVAW